LISASHLTITPYCRNTASGKSPVLKHQLQLPNKTRIYKSSQINLNDCSRHFSHKFRPRASTKTCTELCRTRHQFITGNRDGYFVAFVLVVAHTYIVHVVGAGITTPILSTVGNYDLTPCLRPSKVGEEGPREPRLSSSLMADKRAYNFRCNWCKTIILLGRLNTTRERNSPTLPYIEYATNYSISLKFITRNFDLICGHQLRKFRNDLVIN
jgi:hypothetical protein